MICPLLVPFPLRGQLPAPSAYVGGPHTEDLSVRVVSEKRIKQSVSYDTMQKPLNIKTSDK